MCPSVATSASKSALKMRLSRYGVRRNPFYGIVVTRTSAPRDSKHLDRIGTYNPIPDANGVKHIELDVSKAKYWLGNGVQVSEKVGWLLAKLGIWPVSPSHEHRKGLHLLTDPSTWKLKILGANGKVLEVLSEDEARKKYTGANGLPNLADILKRGESGVDFAKSRADGI